MTDVARLIELNELLEEAKRAPFYRDRLAAAPLASLTDLGRIPITTKEDLRQHSPYGLLCASPEERYDYYESFGTSGKPVSIWLSREDFLHTARQMALCGVKMRSDDVVLIRFPYAISQIAHVFHEAAHQCNACVIPASSRSTLSPFSRVVHMMTELNVSVLACLPLQALLLAETAELLGLVPGRDFPALRAICTAGEPLLGPRRRMLEELWRVPIFDFYGMTEIGTAAVERACRRMHPLTDDFLFEILDDGLSAPVPEGEVGHLVITALRRRATPVIRYLTGDRARLVREPCSCGADLRLELRGRAADALEVDGKRFDLWDLEEIAGEVEGRRLWAVGPRWHGLHFVVEALDPESGVSDETLARIERTYGVRVRIDLVPVGTLYDRRELLHVGSFGKPRYVYTREEMRDKAFVHQGKG